MGIPHGWLAGGVLLLSVWGAGCGRDQAADQAAVLEQAYKAGVLTRQEYEAKKAVLASNAGMLAALDKAYQAGLLTKDEYDGKKAALLASAAPATAAPAAVAPAPAVQPATPAETSPIAPAAAAPAPADTASAPAASAQGNYFRMKLAKLVDPSGFERPMTSATLLIPADWQIQGGTQWVLKDSCNSIQTSFRATGPDGRVVELLPSQNWRWSDDASSVNFMRQDYMQKQQMGTRTCEVMPPMGAADYLKRSIPRIRPNAQVVSIEPMRKLIDQMQAQARQTEQMAQRYGLRQQVRPDAARARLRYSANGQSVEEWVAAVVNVTGTLSPTFNVAAGRQGQAFSYSCTASVTAARAPAGQLDASEKMFLLMFSTYRVDQAWQNRVNGHAQAMQQIELKGVRDRSAIVAKNAEDIRNIQKQGWENQQRSQDHISNQFSEYQRGVETYRNPATGETVELSNQYGHAWVNNRGEYLLSDQASFDPSVTFKEDWKPLEHVKR